LFHGIGDLFINMPPSSKGAAPVRRFGTNAGDSRPKDRETGARLGDT
jgi:hypothetical protein